MCPSVPLSRVPHFAIRHSVQWLTQVCSLACFCCYFQCSCSESRHTRKVSTTLSNVISSLTLYTYVCCILLLGAPLGACKHLKPKHSGATALEASSNPFVITTDRSTYSSKDRVTVTIKAKSGSTDTFKGFLLVARSSGDSKDNLGQFYPNGQSNQAIDCGLGADGITHKTNETKSSDSFEWSPSESYSGPVVFMGAIVKSFNEYISGVSSQPITITSA